MFDIMSTREQSACPTLDARLLGILETWCAGNGMSERALGSAALDDPDLVASLRRGRSPRLVTADGLLAFIGEAPLGPAFRAEVESFLAVTGTKLSTLGRGATGNPSFVAQLRKGVSHTLATVGKVRAWMDAHASAAESREIRERVRGMAAVPVRLLERVPAPAPEDPHRCEPAQDREEMKETHERYLDTREAAALLGLSPRTLDRYRVTGEGPSFFRFGSRVLYLREDLDRWNAGRRRRRGSVDAGTGRSAAL